jgi:hypothetical protein
VGLTCGLKVKLLEERREVSEAARIALGASLRVDQGAALLVSGSTFARDVELNGGLQALAGSLPLLVLVGNALAQQPQLTFTLGLEDTYIDNLGAAHGLRRSW